MIAVISILIDFFIFSSFLVLCSSTNWFQTFSLNLKSFPLNFHFYAKRRCVLNIPAPLLDESIFIIYYNTLSGENKEFFNHFQHDCPHIFLIFYALSSHFRHISQFPGKSLKKTLPLHTPFYKNLQLLLIFLRQPAFTGIGIMIGYFPEFFRIR